MYMYIYIYMYICICTYIYTHRYIMCYIGVPSASRLEKIKRCRMATRKAVS